MGKRENKVEKHLKDSVVAIGGISRKWVSPGVDGVTDQICIIPTTADKLIIKLQQLSPDEVIGDVYFVEVKTVDGVVSSVQEREHARLRAVGAQVRVTGGKAEVDEFMESL